MVNGLLKTFSNSFILILVEFISNWILTINISKKLFCITSRNLQVAISHCEIFSVIFFYSFDISMISKRLKITSIAFLMSSISCSFSTLVSLVPAERSTILCLVVIENSYKLFFFSYYFILFRILKKPFVRNLSINFQKKSLY